MYVWVMRRWVPPLNTQYLEIMAESGEGKCLNKNGPFFNIMFPQVPNCVRDMAWSKKNDTIVAQ